MSGGSARPAPVQDQNWMGIVALVTGVVGLGAVAIVFGVLGLNAARAGRATNRGLSIAGIVLGVIGVLAASVGVLNAAFSFGMTMR